MPKPQFLETDFVNRHRHLAYVRNEDGSGATSSDGAKKKRHRHEVIEGAVQPANDHSHALAEMKMREPEKNEEDSKKIADVLSFYSEAKGHEKAMLKDSQECEDFYYGAEGQWNKKDIQRLDSEERAHITINEAEGKMDVLNGYARDNLTDIRVLATEGGDQAVSDVLNMIIKNIRYQNNYPKIRAKVFEDEIVGGRGFFHSYIDYDNLFEGEIRIKRYPWDQAVMGPHEEEDLEDLEFMCKHKMYSKKKVGQLWPDKKDEIAEMFMGEGRFVFDDAEEPHQQVAGKQYEVSENTINEFLHSGTDIIDTARKTVRVIECRRREYEKIFLIINPEEGVVENASTWTDKQIKQAKTLPGFRVLPRKASRIRITIVAGGVLLSDEYPEDDFDIEEWDLTVVYAKKRGERWWGKMHTLLDPQRELDKWHSQYMDMLNRLGGRGWVYDEETFASPDEATKFRDESSRSGFFLKVANVQEGKKNVPVQIGGLERMPAEIIQAVVMAESMIERLANVPPGTEALQSASISGRALIQKEKRGLIGNRFLFDNMILAERNLFRRVIKMIQKLYQDDPSRIYRILGTEAARDQEQEAQIGGQLAVDETGQPSPNWTEEGIAQLFQNADLTQYDVIVSETDWSPSMQEAYFSEWSEIAGQGVPVPFDQLVMMSRMPKAQKEKWLASYQAQQQRAADLEDKKLEVELAKTQVAADAKMQSKGPSQ